jgi:hypothetical protein
MEKEPSKHSSKERKFLNPELSDIHKVNLEILALLDEGLDSSVDYFSVLIDYIEYHRLTLEQDKKMLEMAIEDGFDGHAKKYRQSIKDRLKIIDETRVEIDELTEQIDQIETDRVSTKILSEQLAKLDRSLSDLIIFAQGINLN